MPNSLDFVVLLGSLRAGFTHRIIAETLPTLAPKGVSVTSLGSVGEFPLYDQDVQERDFPDAVTAMGNRIARADGVIIVTPEYNYSVPGGLKNALDWMSSLQPQPFVRKPVAIQTASPGMIGGARAQYHLRQILVFLDADVLNKPEVIVSQLQTEVDQAHRQIGDTDTRRFVGKQIEALGELVRSRR